VEPSVHEVEEVEASFTTNRQMTPRRKCHEVQSERPKETGNLDDYAMDLPQDQTIVSDA